MLLEVSGRPSHMSRPCLEDYSVSTRRQARIVPRPGETGARRCMHLSLACRLRSCHDYKNWEWDTELTTWLAWLLQSPKGVPGGLAVRAVELHAATTRL